MMILDIIAWGSTALAGLFLALMLFGIDDVFGGMFEARVVAFFGAGLGWGSIMMLDAGYPLPISLAVGVGSGVLLASAALAMVFAIRKFSKSLEPSSLLPVGQRAEVSIPPDSTMSGMIRLMHRGQLAEFPAHFETPVTAGSVVIVVSSVANKLSVRAVDSAETVG
jgi:hypothetical protein